MQLITIKECSNTIMAEFERNQYAENTLRTKAIAFNCINRWFLDHGTPYYDKDIAVAYEEYVFGRYQRGEIQKPQKNTQINAMRYISEYAETGTVTLGNRKTPSLLCKYYFDIREAVIRNEDWSASQRKNISHATHTYFRWLQDRDINSLMLVTEGILRTYIMECADRLNPGSLDAIRRSLKHLHQFLYEKGYTQINLTPVLSFSTPPMRRIQRPVPIEEIAAVLSIIDRNTPTGKRDFAMILLATVTGLRCVDICKLSFSDIDWVSGEIRLKQSKTGNYLALPLTTDVGEAVKDYILNGRPSSQLNTVFLSAKSPYRVTQTHSLHNQFNHYRSLVGLPNCPIHGLRRAVGTNMVIAGIPVSTVAQVLGHTHIAATKQYISLDSVHLKQCALDFSRLPKRRTKK